jgi:hypothetical protein
LGIGCCHVRADGSDEPVAVAGGGFADQLGEALAAAPLVLFGLFVGPVLGVTVGVVKVPLTGAVPMTFVPELTVILDSRSDGSGCVFDTAYVRRRSASSAERYTDLVVEFRDRPGVSLRGRLEDAPDQVVTLDPNRVAFCALQDDPRPQKIVPGGRT